MTGVELKIVSVAGAAAIPADRWAFAARFAGRGEGLGVPATQYRVDGMAYDLTENRAACGRDPASHGLRRGGFPGAARRARYTPGPRARSCRNAGRSICPTRPSRRRLRCSLAAPGTTAAKLCPSDCFAAVVPGAAREHRRRLRDGRVGQIERPAFRHDLAQRPRRGPTHALPLQEIRHGEGLGLRGLAASRTSLPLTSYAMPSTRYCVAGTPSPFATASESSATPTCRRESPRRGNGDDFQFHPGHAFHVVDQVVGGNLDVAFLPGT